MKNTARTGNTGDLPSALDRIDEILGMAEDRRIVLFLDYDGTLTPIVSRPELAVLSEEMRHAVSRAAARFPVAVISGRDLKDVRSLVAVEGLTYAGSHGFDIEVPGSGHVTHRIGEEFVPRFDKAEAALAERLEGVDGAQIERKAFSIAVHYRRVDAIRVGDVEGAVDAVLAETSGLRKKGGKKVFELQPDVPWDKGRAVLWLLDELGWGGEAPFPVYIGDDLTDEDAFDALSGRGIGIVVRDEPRRTVAAYALESTEETGLFLARLVSLGGDLPGAGG